MHYHNFKLLYPSTIREDICRDSTMFLKRITITLSVVLLSNVQVISHRNNNNNERIFIKNKIELLNKTCVEFNLTGRNCSCDKFPNICKIMREQPVESVYLKNFLHTHAAIASISSGIGIIGNILVVAVAMSYNNRVPIVCNKLITHLAFYDLSFAIFQLIDAIPKFWTEKWVYGERMCKVFRSAEYLGSMLAVGVILIICVERYLKIVHPFKKFEISGWMLKVLLVGNFMLAVVGALPLFLFHQMDWELEYCKLNWPEHGDSIKYNITLFVLYFLIPVVIITKLYAKIIFTIKSQHFYKQKINNPKYSAANKLSNRNNDDEREDENQEYERDEVIIQTRKDSSFQKRPTSDNRTIIISLVAVVIAFILFVFPRHMVYIYFDSRGWHEDYIYSEDELSVDAYFYLNYIAHIPYTFHVAINPVIYSLIDSRWRKDLKKLFTKFHRLPKGEGKHLSTYNSQGMSSGFPTTQHRTNTDMEHAW